MKTKAMIGGAALIAVLAVFWFNLVPTSASEVLDETRETHSASVHYQQGSDFGSLSFEPNSGQGDVAVTWRHGLDDNVISSIPLHRIGGAQWIGGTTFLVTGLRFLTWDPAVFTCQILRLQASFGSTKTLTVTHTHNVDAVSDLTYALYDPSFGGILGYDHEAKRVLLIPWAGGTSAYGTPQVIATTTTVPELEFNAQLEMNENDDGVWAKNFDGAFAEFKKVSGQWVVTDLTLTESEVFGNAWQVNSAQNIGHLANIEIRAPDHLTGGAYEVVNDDTDQVVASGVQPPLAEEWDWFSIAAPSVFQQLPGSTYKIRGAGYDESELFSGIVRYPGLSVHGGLSTDSGLVPSHQACVGNAKFGVGAFLGIPGSPTEQNPVSVVATMIVGLRDPSTGADPVVESSPGSGIYVLQPTVAVIDLSRSFEAAQGALAGAFGIPPDPNLAGQVALFQILAESVNQEIVATDVMGVTIRANETAQPAKSTASLQSIRRAVRKWCASVKKDPAAERMHAGMVRKLRSRR